MDVEFNLEKRERAVKKATRLGYFEPREERVVTEALEWFLAPFEKRGEVPTNRKVKRLVRMLVRCIE